MKSGFTVIELLAVMLIIAVLSSAAVSQFIDFRKEARAASTRYNLNTLRVGIKNQIQQANLRCNRTLKTINEMTLFYNSFLVNDVTQSSNGPDRVFSYTTPICNTQQVTNPSDRKFFDLGGAKQARYDLSGYGIGTVPIPANPFVSVEGVLGVDYTGIQVVNVTSSQTLSFIGGPCAWVDFIADFQIHWVYVMDTQTIFPGTNTEGVSECSF